MAAPIEKLRDRKDHWLPRGYLKGFIGPSRASKHKPLCCYNPHAKEWGYTSPKMIGFGKGFYDYAEGTDYSTVTHPDSAFARLEREYPLRCKEMAANNFAGWEHDKNFLLEFMQMVRARSPLAMQQREAEARKHRGATITAVHPELRAITVDSLELRPLPESYIRNYTISQMLEELKAGASWMTPLDWCLRYTDEEDIPYCTTDQALFLIATVRSPSIDMQFLQYPDTVLVFPLCWQACLFGSTRKFDKSYDRADPGQLVSLLNDQKQNAERFVISPAAI